MLNTITVMGRLTKDPELRSTASGTPVCTVTLAVERDFADKATGKRETDFIDCVTWSKQAEFVSRYFQKGSLAAVRGRLQIRKWTDSSGSNRSTTEIQVEPNGFYFAGSKPEGGSGERKPAGHAVPIFADLDEDDEALPF